MVMQTQIKTLLWRVTWLGRSGVSSPTYYVEAKKGRNERETRRNAVAAAKERSRLADFPKQWYCRVADVTEGSYLDPNYQREKRELPQ